MAALRHDIAWNAQQPPRSALPAGQTALGKAFEAKRRSMAGTGGVGVSTNPFNTQEEEWDNWVEADERRQKQLDEAEKLMTPEQKEAVDGLFVTA